MPNYKYGGNGSYGTLNTKYNLLQAQLAELSGGGGTPQNLADVLATGNSAGGLDIINVDNIALNTINGQVYPPAYTTPTLSAVMTAGNSASTDLNMNSHSITNVVNINGSAYPPAVSTPTLAQVLNAGDTATDESIIIKDTAQYNKIQVGKDQTPTNTYTKIETAGLTRNEVIGDDTWTTELSQDLIQTRYLNQGNLQTISTLGGGSVSNGNSVNGNFTGMNPEDFSAGYNGTTYTAKAYQVINPTLQFVGGYGQTYTNPTTNITAQLSGGSGDEGIKTTDNASGDFARFTPTTLYTNTGNQSWANIIAYTGGNPTIDAVLSAGAYATDKTQYFNSNSTSNTTQINENQIVIQTTAQGSPQTNNMTVDSISLARSNTGDQIALFNPYSSAPYLYITDYPNSHTLQLYAGNLTANQDFTITASSVNLPSCSINGTSQFNGNDIYGVDNIQLNTINGMSPTTIGLTWTDLNGTNAYANLPNQSWSVWSGSQQTNLTAGGFNTTDSNSNQSSLGSTSLVFSYATNTFVYLGYNGGTPSLNIGYSGGGSQDPNSILNGKSLFLSEWNYSSNSRYYLTLETNPSSNNNEIISGDQTYGYVPLNLVCSQLLVNGSPLPVNTPKITANGYSTISTSFGAGSWTNVVSAGFNFTGAWTGYKTFQISFTLTSTAGYEPTGAGYIQIQTTAGTYNPYANNVSYPTATGGNNSTFSTSGTSTINFTDVINIDNGNSTGATFYLYLGHNGGTWNVGGTWSFTIIEL